MRNIRLISAVAAALIAGLLSAAAQNPPRGTPPLAAARPYKPVAITPAMPLADAENPAAPLPGLTPICPTT